MSSTSWLPARLAGHRAVRLLLALALGFGATVFLLAPAGAQPSRVDIPPDPRRAAVEKDFLTGMIPHHRSAVMMAELAVKKATKPELRRLAQSIIDSQQDEIALMSNYLRDWYGMQPPAEQMMTPEMMRMMDMPMMHGMMPDMMAGMQRLEAKSGAAFDVEFVQDMSTHHAMAVMMAGAVPIAGHHQALKMLAADIIVAQGEEIKQMQTWLDQWYGVKRVAQQR